MTGLKTNIFQHTQQLLSIDKNTDDKYSRLVYSEGQKVLET